MESITEKTPRWNLRVIIDFLNLGRVSHEYHQYKFLRSVNVDKGRHDFFQQESHQRVFCESCSFL